MGYGYGVWLVYNEDVFPTEHIGHFTISCFMNHDDALDLYHEITYKYGTNTKIYVDGNSVKFPCGFYEHDTNNLHSWGYKGKCSNWINYKRVCNNYKCDFSNIPHTSIEYNKNEYALNVKEIDKIELECQVCVVDIRSDNPSDWKILKREE